MVRMPRRSAADVAESRVAELAVAVDLASVIGLEGLTIGSLASELGTSKSSLATRFGSKQDLQRSVLEAAIERFTAVVWLPVADRRPGIDRLEAIVDQWIQHFVDRNFPGGCFVTTASVEYDARPGPLHDDVAAAARRWLAVLEADAARAIADGDLPADRDPADVALELYSLASGGSVVARLTGATDGLERTRHAMRRAIGLH